MKWASFLLYGLCGLWVGTALAHSPYLPGGVVPGCELTPTITGADRFYPGQENIIRSNKLIRPAGKAENAPGQPLIFIGRVLDSRCIPVEGAHVELWQADATGQYRVANAGNLMSPEQTFAGSGKAVTNNQGEFRFETVFPGPSRSRAPLLHVRVSHPDLEPITTELYFYRDDRNRDDPVLNTLPKHPRQRVQILIQPALDGISLQGYAEIVLKGNEKYQGF